MNGNNVKDKKEITPGQIFKKAIALAITFLLLLLMLVLPLSKIALIRKSFIYLTLFISAAVAAAAIIFRRREYPDKFVRFYYHFADFLFTLNVVLIAVQIFFAFLFFPATVDKTSMYPNLADGDKIIVRSRALPKHLDVVILKVDREHNVLADGVVDGELIVKRVIGMPGDTFYYEDGYLFLNGEKVEESYLFDENGEFKSGNIYDTKAADFHFSMYAKVAGESICAPGDESCRIPEDYYFVLGDNRKHSVDSRRLGLFHKSQIVGIAKYRVKRLFDWEKI